MHWDLLVEIAGQERLATWRLAQNPLERTGAIPAERLADHRRAYLEFEGALSGKRGRVRIIERGPATIERWNGNELSALLEGARLRGRFEITADTQRGLMFRASGTPHARKPS